MPHPLKPPYLACGPKTTNNLPTNINGRYGGGSGVCEYTFGPVTFECGPKLPRSTRLSPKPLKSTPRDHPEGSQSQPRGASVQRCPQSELKTVKQLFRGTPLHANALKYCACQQNRASRNSRHTAMFIYVFLSLSTSIYVYLRLSMFIYVCYVSATSSAAQSPLSTRTGAKNDGS